MSLSEDDLDALAGRAEDLMLDLQSANADIRGSGIGGGGMIHIAAYVRKFAALSAASASVATAIATRMELEDDQRRLEASLRALVR